jgi:hypothetical protein
MPALSKKYKINYKRRYTIPKNKKQRGHKSIKVYHTRVKASTRKRKHYMGGDIEVPVIYDIFPSGQTYQPNTDCLEKECDKKDAGEKTTTCLNTRIVMNLFSQTLDDSEQATMDRIDGNFTPAERKHVQDLTEKYLTNYVDSLFPKSFFSKNSADLTPENATKLKDLLEVIKPEYVVYLTQNSNLSDEIKQTIRATTQEALNVVVDNAAPALIDAETETEPEVQIQPEAEPEVQMPTEAEAQIPPEPEPEAQIQPEPEPEVQIQPEPEPEAQRQQQAEEAEAQRQQQQAEAKKAAKKAEKERFNAAKKAEMDQRFAQRRAESAAADVKRKEDLAEKKAARAAANLIKEENRAAAKTLKNITTAKKSSGSATRKKR